MGGRVLRLRNMKLNINILMIEKQIVFMLIV